VNKRNDKIFRRIIFVLGNDERLVRARLSSLISALARLASVGASLISIPLVYSYLSKEEFAVWVIINNLTALLSFADFGVGNGLINSVAKRKSLNNTELLRKSISNAVFVLALFSFIFIAIFFLVNSCVDISAAMGVGSNEKRKLVSAALTAFVLFYLASMPLNVVNKIYIGLQQGYFAALSSCTASIVSLLLLWLAVSLELSLPYLIAYYASGGFIVLLINCIIFFFRNKALVPKIKDLGNGEVKSLIKVGVAFLLLQIDSGLLLNLDGFIIAKYVGTESFADFSIVYKIVAIVLVGIGIILQPLWPAYRDAYFKKDYHWISCTLKDSLKKSILMAGIFGVGLFLFMPIILDIWMSKKVEFSKILVSGFIAWSLIEVVSMNIATLLNAINILWMQVIFGWISIAISLPLKIYIVMTYGIDYLPLVTASVVLVCVVMPLSIFVFNRNRGIGIE